jgi:hypothetical protein
LRSSFPLPTAAYTRTLLSKSTSAVMQIFSRPSFLTQAARGLTAQLPQTSPRTIGPILMGGEFRQVVTD